MSAEAKTSLPVFSVGTSVARFGEYIAFVDISHDVCPPNPLTECDGMGHIWSFCRRHVNFKHPENVERHPDDVPLSYFEHGACRWSTQGRLDGIPYFRWDGVHFAGLWIPDEHTVAEADRRELVGDVRKAWMREQAEAACQVYTAWCNGEVLFVSAVVHKFRQDGDNEYDEPRDYRFQVPELEESCGGFYDEASAVEFVIEALQSFARQEGLELVVAST